ncbi:efflux RND transporter periplasmic adaptor subunit [Aestuariibacter halophilus]|uniref:Efflux RND transporter periplasmic adaptor subunit n=1 Tax=Fluctibacter halophilus TaxID=226011 RepID=A0ABS8GC42_9ALTE|nr:efflux RND transporter periplasmic adaptor subunit [Aestuariibacter halophilus]MCC2618102.1 efflux RND transporter periplasmic adaptor subunit [Aestuariibacter halophilus]
MSTSRFHPAAIPVAAIVGLLLMVAWMAGMFSDTQAPGTDSLPTSEYTDTFTVVADEALHTEAVVASIEARDITRISSQLLARITAINVRAGDRVNAGDVLITLENDGLLAQKAQASARIEAVQSSLQEAQANQQRISRLREQGLASASEQDSVNATASRLSAELDAARQQLSEVDNALEYSQIRAPIAGVVIDRLAEPGNMATPGNPLLSLYNPRSLQVQANVRESLAVQLQKGQTLEVHVDAIAQTINADIVEIVPAADLAARSFLIKLSLPEQSQLKQGMSAHVNVPVDTRSVIRIPRKLVQEYGQLDMVWVVENELLSRRMVRTGNTDGEYVVILRGLQPGETVALPKA